jgi:hypothetical protein
MLIEQVLSTFSVPSQAPYLEVKWLDDYGLSRHISMKNTQPLNYESMFAGFKKGILSAKGI